MSGRKETRPSAATLRRAAENGNASETARLSTWNDIMPAALASRTGRNEG